MTENPVKDGWLSKARRVPSPNFNERPDPQDISLLVIHHISLPAGQFEQSYQGTPLIELFFTNQLPLDLHPTFQSLKDLQVSAHLLIYRDGTLVQFVPFNKRAWHAGVSEFQGRPNCNDYSLGIEMEGDGEHDFTDKQYEALAQVTKKLLSAFPKMTEDRITGHSDIAPGRKTDPGPCFDWKKYRSMIKTQ